MSRIPFRWIVITVFAISSALNYLDRQILAAAAPAMKEEFGLTNQAFGQLISVFSIPYAMASPLMGLLLDRIGLTRGISMAAGLWSAAGIATGLANSFAGLLAARVVLGIGEAAGIPATGKASRIYLEPKERAGGAALTQLGLSVGAVLAPVLVNLAAPQYGWRGAFLIAGFLGFLWIPLWWLVDRKATRQPEEPAANQSSALEILRDRQIWGFIAANFCSMTVYTLWTNWTTIFLTTRYGLTQAEANELAPLPHLFAYFGGMAGFAISYRLIARGMAPLAARRRALAICALMMVSAAVAPAMPTPLGGTLAASFSLFWATGWGVNLYTMPVDAYGHRAAFSVSLLTMAYGILQILISPLFGAMIDAGGFEMVCLAAGTLPLVGYAIVHLTRR